jgi:hypothetical protein
MRSGAITALLIAAVLSKPHRNTRLVMMPPFALMRRLIHPLAF